MWRDERTGLWKLCCWCAKRDGSEQTYWRVADVRAARGYGVVKWRSGYEATVWYRRLWQEVGLLSPASVTLPPLETPGDALAVMYAGLALLFALRWITNPGEPVTFARSFAPAWCEQSWTPTETYDRINKLSDAGVIKRAGTAPKSRSLLWLPGVAR